MKHHIPPRNKFTRAISVTAAAFIGFSLVPALAPATAAPAGTDGTSSVGQTTGAANSVKAKKNKKKTCRVTAVLNPKDGPKKVDRKLKNARKKHKVCVNRKKREAKRKRAMAQGVHTKAMNVARAQIGDPYRYGAAGPNAFDCSGLTSFSYARAGKAIPRTSGAQYSAARKVSRSNARVGDLVFFHGSSGVYHVGLYAGGNKILNAPRTGSNVRVERIWSSSVSFGRMS